MFSQVTTDGAAPSLVASVGRYASDLTLGNGQHLPIWLPVLSALPLGWVIGQIDASESPTRVVLHRNASGTAWDACGVLNVYAFTGSVPREVIEAEIACTLRGIGANNTDSQPRFIPSRPGLDVTAASAGGEFVMGGHRVRAQYTAYLVQAKTGAEVVESKRIRRGGLVEHNTFITAQAEPKTHREQVELDDSIYAALRTALT